MPISLDADLGIEHAADLKAKLEGELKKRRGLVIDAAAVERVHSASLQLLCAFTRERAAAGHATRIDTPSEPFREAAQLLGLDQIFGIKDSGEAR